MQIKNLQNELGVTDKLSLRQLVTRMGTDRTAGVDHVIQLKTQVNEDEKSAKTEEEKVLVKEFKEIVDLILKTDYLMEGKLRDNPASKKVENFLQRIKELYWDKFTEHAELFEKIVQSSDLSLNTKIRNEIIEKVFGKKEESQLTLAEKLVLDMRLTHESLIKDGKLEAGEDMLKGNSYEKTKRQVEMYFNNLLGRISALSAGGGKSNAYIWSVTGFFHMRQKMGQEGSIAEFLGANGVDYWQGDRFSELAKLYSREKQGDGVVGRLIAYDIQTRGFVELRARSQDAELNRALENVDLRIADEADVAALSRVAFVLGSGDNKAGKEQVEHIENFLNAIDELGTIKIEDPLKAESVAKDTGLSFTMKDEAIIYSEGLKNTFSKLRNKVKRGGDTEFLLDAQRDNIFRAKYILEGRLGGKKTLDIVDGQPATIESGVRRANTTDQSSAYNIAVVLLKIRQIETIYGKGTAKANEEINKLKLNKDNIKLSESVGESTISQVFSRSSGRTLNFGGSATMDLAKEIAHTIYGSGAVEIEGSNLNAVYNKGLLKMRVTDRNTILNEAIATAKKFLVEGKQDHGEVFGAIDASYLRDVFVGALKELAIDKGISKTEFENFVSSLKAESLTVLRDRLAERFSALKQYTDKIEVIDAVLAGENAEQAANIAKKAKDKLVFTNESGLRGMDFQWINIRLLDGHNFSEGDLLQALGRAGRNTKDTNYKQTVYLERNGLKDSLTQD